MSSNILAPLGAVYTSVIAAASTAKFAYDASRNGDRSKCGIYSILSLGSAAFGAALAQNIIERRPLSDQDQGILFTSALLAVYIASKLLTRAPAPVLPLRVPTTKDRMDASYEAAYTHPVLPAGSIQRVEFTAYLLFNSDGNGWNLDPRSNATTELRTLTIG